jgi:hypothetical protein
VAESELRDGLEARIEVRMDGEAPETRAIGMPFLGPER